jgi:hypothetical protein
MEDPSTGSLGRGNTPGDVESGIQSSLESRQLQVGSTNNPIQQAEATVAPDASRGWLTKLLRRNPNQAAPRTNTNNPVSVAPPNNQSNQQAATYTSSAFTRKSQSGPPVSNVLILGARSAIIGRVIWATLKWCYILILVFSSPGVLIAIGAIALLLYILVQVSGSSESIVLVRKGLNDSAKTGFTNVDIKFWV